MKLKLFYLLVMMFISIEGIAAEKDYTLCTVAGFYDGSDNRFLTDLAERVAAKNNLFGDEQCTNALKEGKAAGERYNRQVSERRVTDNEIIRNAHRFSNMIYNSLLSRIKY